jgi:hypothetical protein
MEPWRANQLALAGCLARLRPPRHPVVGALRLPDRQWRSGALDLLDAETNACQEAESRAREEACHQMGCAGEMGQYLDHFLPCTHHGYPLRWLGLFESVQRWARLLQDVTRAEDQGLQRDMGRGSRDRARHGPMDQQSAACWRAHGRRVALGVAADTARGPWHRRLGRSAAQVCEAEAMPHRVESLCF